jgi:heme-degrading monooxygenase HmoA
MFTRTVTFTGATDLDAGLSYLRDTVVPLLRQQNGLRGISASVDRSGGVMGVLTVWDSEAARDASESPMGKVRAEAQRVIGGEVTVEYFEELLVVTDRPPAVGDLLLLRRNSMDPALIDENLDYFRREVLPQMKASPGFRSLRSMVNRQTGEGMVGTVWADETTLDGAAVAAEARRQEAAQHGVALREQSRREIVYVELR